MKNLALEPIEITILIPSFRNLPLYEIVTGSEYKFGECQQVYSAFFSLTSSENKNSIALKWREAVWKCVNHIIYRHLSEIEWVIIKVSQS